MAGRRIIIVGGGFSGATAAVQLVRKLADPVAITIVELSPVIGPGLAYGTGNPSFRLNAISGAHSIDVADPEHFTSWCSKEGLAQRDPQSVLPGGELFVRRRDYGRYLAETVAAHSAWPNGSTISHVQDRATDIRATDDGVEVSLASGTAMQADMAILASGNPPLRRPPWATGDAASHPFVILEPMREGLDEIARDANVLVVGAGLTALDVVAGLIDVGHAGQITVASRRGLRPQPQPARILAPSADPPEPPVVPLDLLEGELPEHALGEHLTALGLLRGIRRHCSATDAQGRGWQAGFDAVAFPLSRIWPKLPLPEKRRVLRHLRPYYDAHRFRTPPMTDALVRSREGAGQVQFRKAAIEQLEAGEDASLVAHLRAPGGLARSESFDAVINCTGFDSAKALELDPMLARLHESGTIMPHPTGLGILTDSENRVVMTSGDAMPELRAIGPLTAGVFGDPLGAFFISAQVHRLVPGIARQLDLTLVS